MFSAQILVGEREGNGDAHRVAVGNRDAEGVAETICSMEGEG